MNKHPELVVMLTYNDHTVLNARELFEKCRDSKAKFWGFKEDPLPLPEMRELFAMMKDCGKTTSLEVVAYTEEECVDGAKMAVECGCDLLMGTMYFDSVRDICKDNGLKYMPFVGDVYERPSILGGTVEGMIEEALQCLDKGVDGIDLLGYRFTGDAFDLNKRFVAAVPAPVCIAGSVNSYQRLDELKEAGPWSFTIGGAFFDKCFGEDFKEQIDTVCEYMEH
ncbi:MAG: hypothetical protein IJM62_00540 [Lachnospiraceae bacterium]|nr:hypothetical protein [Lachnospiraceae bacterium]